MHTNRTSASFELQKADSASKLPGQPVGDFGHPPPGRAHCRPLWWRNLSLELVLAKALIGLFPEVSEDSQIVSPAELLPVHLEQPRIFDGADAAHGTPHVWPHGEGAAAAQSDRGPHLAIGVTYTEVLGASISPPCTPATPMSPPPKQTFISSPACKHAWRMVNLCWFSGPPALARRLCCAKWRALSATG